MRRGHDDLPEVIVPSFIVPSCCRQPRLVALALLAARPPPPRRGPSASTSASTAPSRPRPTTSAIGSSSSATSRPDRPRSTTRSRADSSSTPARASGSGRTSPPASRSRTSRATMRRARRRAFPHPFFFNQPREVTGEATGVKRSETAVHVQAMYLVNPGGRLRLVLSGGPSFFDVRAGRRDRGHRHRDLSVRHGDVRLGQDEPRERLGGRLQRRRGRDVDADAADSASAAWCASRARPSISTRRATGRSRWTQAASMRAAGSGCCSEANDLTTTLTGRGLHVRCRER